MTRHPFIGRDSLVFRLGELACHAVLSRHLALTHARPPGKHSNWLISQSLSTGWYAYGGANGAYKGLSASTAMRPVVSSNPLRATTDERVFECLAPRIGACYGQSATDDVSLH